MIVNGSYRCHYHCTSGIGPEDFSRGFQMRDPVFFSVRVRQQFVMVFVASLVFCLESTPAHAVLSDRRAPTCEGFPAKGPIQVTRDTPNRANGLGCGLIGREVLFGDVGLTIPAPGETAMIEAFGSDSRELTVAVDPTGVVTFDAETSEAVVVDSQTDAKAVRPSNRAFSARALTNGCDSYAYNLGPNHVVYSHQFYRGDGAVPAGGTATQFADAMYAAASNITDGRSPCGTDGVDVSFNYAGATTVESDITFDALCLPQGSAGDDSVNSVDMGPMSSSYAGYACVRWGSSGNVTEADIRLNSNKPWTYTPNDSVCTTYNRFDVEGVLTHEFGHIYGLQHVGERWATMYSVALSCFKDQRSLGIGDLNGLRALY